MSIKKSIVLRIRIAFLLVFLIAGAIVFRIIKIQYIEREEWIGLGESIGMKVVNVKAARGNIYADDGRLLATSLPFYRLAFDPYLPADNLFNNNIDSLCHLLSKYFKDLTANQYKLKITKARKEYKRYITLNRKLIGYLDKKQIEKWPIFKEGRSKGGLIFEKVEKRFLPFSHLGYRTIGNVDANDHGVVGLEYSFNRQLAGVNGNALFQKMSGGGWRPVRDGTEKRPVDGFDIQTTIDVDLQDVAESALLRKLKKHKADYGVVIVMEVSTGKIKAISNLSRNDKGDYFERYNYAIGSQGSREPGSTFKLASMIALFEETNVRLTDSVQTGNGELTFFDKTIRDHKQGGFGMLSVQEVFEKSSNIGTAKLITRYFGRRPEKFIQYLKKMKLHQTLGFQMAGEGRPFIKTPSDTTWSGVSLPWMSFGYEVEMTPLQMLTLYNAIANKGKMVKPMIVKSVMRADHVIQGFKTEVLNDRICSSKTLKKIKVMLEGVVERGTASNINNSMYKIAGKTGTAKNVKHGKYVKEYYTSFVGYFPAKAPQYSCIVVIDNPKGYQIHGSNVSAPVFKEVADKIYSFRLELQPVKEATQTVSKSTFPYIKAGYHDELIMICNKLGISNHSEKKAEWVTTKVADQTIYWENNSVQFRQVPDVRGMSLRDAIFILENLGLKVKVRGRGRVTYQSLAPKAKIVKGSTIKLYMS